MYCRFFLCRSDKLLLEECYESLSDDWTDDQVRERLEKWVKQIINRHPTAKYRYGWEKKSPPAGWVKQEIARLESQADKILSRVEELKSWRQ